MIKEFLTTALLAAALPAAGQAPFTYSRDLPKILSRTQDARDDLAYSRLRQRFAANDVTLTDFEVLALLIGFTAQPAYKPYEDLDAERKIYAANGSGNYQEALTGANAFLATHPVSVKALYEKGYAYYKLGQADSADLYAAKGRRIFAAMRFSGPGTSAESPMFALGPADGQDYIRKVLQAKIGIMGSGRDKSGKFLDMLEAIPGNGQKPVNMYFIIQHATDKMFSPEDRKRMQEAGKP